jgi:PAS domain S-box-containing protein
LGGPEHRDDHAQAIADLERRLRESEERWHALVDSTGDGVFMVDTEGRFVFVNAFIAKSSGFPAEAFVGRHFLELIRPEDHDTVRNNFERAVAGEDVPAYELAYRTATGKLMWAELNTAPLVTDGEITGVFAISRNIQARKEVEAALRESEEQLRQLQKMEALGTLAGGIAHDFNNLLTGILGMADLLKRQHTLGDGVYHPADVIERATQRAATLTRQLLGFARKSSPDRRPVDAHRLIDDICDILERTFEKDIEVIKRFETREPVAMGDAGQLQQVLMNLAINARDAMPNGGLLSIETEHVDLDDSPIVRTFALNAARHLRITVRDTGTGIGASVRERIFEPFFTTKPQGKGSGMGLAVVYGIVRAHNGAIDVDTRAGEGTAVSIYLPLAGEGAVVAKPQPAAPSCGRGVVLVVDDEELLRETTRALLESLGYEVVLCSGGHEAVEIYGSCHHKIDVALIDVSMPVMNGWTCLELLKRINPHLEVIMTSGYGRSTPDGLEHEVDFLAKPYVLEQLAAAVARHLPEPD